MNLKDKGVILFGKLLINKRNIFLIFFGVLCCMPKELQATDYCKFSDKIIKEFTIEFAKPHGLHLTGKGGAMMDDIKKLILNFLSFEVLSVEEARTLFVDLSEEFLFRVNHDEKVRPFLHNYPFRIENLKMVIGFENSQRQITSDGHVALILIGKNQRLYFDAYDSETEKFYTLHEEPYEESVRIVHESREAKKS